METTQERLGFIYKSLKVGDLHQDCDRPGYPWFRVTKVTGDKVYGIRVNYYLEKFKDLVKEHGRFLVLNYLITIRMYNLKHFNYNKAFPAGNLIVSYGALTGCIIDNPDEWIN